MKNLFPIFIAACFLGVSASAQTGTANYDGVSAADLQAVQDAIDDHVEDDLDIDPTNEIQVGDGTTITGEGVPGDPFVAVGDGTGTDDQQIGRTGDTLTLEDGGAPIDLSDLRSPANLDNIADSFTSADGTVINGGTADGLDLRAMDVTEMDCHWEFSLDGAVLAEVDKNHTWRSAYRIGVGFAQPTVPDFDTIGSGTQVEYYNPRDDLIPFINDSPCPVVLTVHYNNAGWHVRGAISDTVSFYTRAVGAPDVSAARIDTSSILSLGSPEGVVAGGTISYSVLVGAGGSHTPSISYQVGYSSGSMPGDSVITTGFINTIISVGYVATYQGSR